MVDMTLWRSVLMVEACLLLGQPTSAGIRRPLQNLPQERSRLLIRRTISILCPGRKI